MEELVLYNDVFDLNRRVKQIRKSYNLYINRRTGKVELHDGNFYGKCMEFNLPVTPEILQKIDKTRIEHSDKLFKEIEMQNRKLQEECIKSQVQKAHNEITKLNGENYVS